MTETKKDAYVTFRISKEFKNLIRLAAEKENTSISLMTRRLIDAGLKNWNGK